MVSCLVEKEKHGDYQQKEYVIVYEEIVEATTSQLIGGVGDFLKYWY